MNSLKGLLVILILASFSPHLFAQIDYPEGGASADFSGLPLDLLPPGARALALGGAFTGVADDSTAALANPAGLTNLSAPEVAVYFRYTDADVTALDSDAYNSALNAAVGPLNKTYSDSSTQVSFASFVYPVERFVFAGFYSNQLDFSALQSAEDVYLDDIERPSPAPDSPVYSFFDQYTNVNSIAAKVENYGLSMAFRITDQFSVGLTLKDSVMKVDSNDFWRLDYFSDVEYVLADVFYGVALCTNFPYCASREEAGSFLPVVLDVNQYQTTVNGSDNSLTADLGLFLKTEQWSFGLVYHQGAKFKLDTIGTYNFDFGCNGDPSTAEVGLCQGLVTYLESLEGEEAVDLHILTETRSGTEIRLPSVISFGTAWRPTDTILVSLDISHIDYSVLTSPKQITFGFELDVNDVPARQEFYDDYIRNLTTPLTEDIDDSVVFNLGFEKSIVMQTDALRLLALRAGVFTVEDHDGNTLTDHDDTVWTLGIGTTWGKQGIGEKLFQVDLGAAFAQDATTVVLSGIYRF